MKKLLPFLLVFVFSIFSFAQKRALSVEDLWNMKRISDVTLSPDNKTIAFTLKVYSLEDNGGQSDIYLIDSDGKNLRPLLNTKENEGQPSFSPNGKLIAYSYKGQLWQCDLKGKNNKPITDIYSGAYGIRWSNDGSKILFLSDVYPECSTDECNKKRDQEIANQKANVKVIDELLYRHWDHWRGEKRTHIFLKDLKSGKRYDLNLNSKVDVPTLALGSANDYNFSPDGKEVAFTMNNDEVLATSTNNDIFIMNVEKLKENEATPYEKISVSKGSDSQPVYSPDGKYIAFCSMKRAGFEADKQSIVLYDRETKKLKNLTKQYDISAGEIVWSPDSKFIYYSAANEIYNSIYKLNIITSENECIVKNRYNTNLSISSDGKTLYFRQQSSSQPYEIFSSDNNGEKITQLSFVNQKLLSEIEMNDIETFWSEGAEGAKVQSIIAKPPFFEPNKKYPMIFLIHGGPQGHWSDDFHYRWNIQMFASQGHVVVAVNPRGSTGYGQDFTDGISKDWGGKVYTDLMNAYDYAIENYDFIDSKNTFAAGASYGGYMINWIEGHTDRFNALVSHDGVYNLESMYGTTEELWFPEWENGGAPWENRELYEKWSPSNFVENFKTPMLVIQGGKDYRVPEGQAFELFTALQKMGVDSKFVYFPEENHFVLKPQNSKFWWKSVFEWFEKYNKRN